MVLLPRLLLFFVYVHLLFVRGASVKLCLCQCYLLVVLATTIFNTFVVSFFVYVHSLICLIAPVRFCKALLMPMLFVD